MLAVEVFVSNDTNCASIFKNNKFVGTKGFDLYVN